jgi:BlaI family transcriptional regulator, penicillinase repressor
MMLVMAKTDAPKPTEAELQILSVLWRRGPSTVREVHDELGTATGYTTVLKLMQIMTEKGLLARDLSSRSHVYRAVQSESTTQRRIVGDLLHRAFGGSARKLVAAALSSRKASPAELDEIHKLLEQYKKKGDVP